MDDCFNHQPINFERKEKIMTEVYMLFGVSFGIQILFAVIMIIAAVRTPATERSDLNNNTDKGGHI
jgi:FtsH-binding integral membrane protein